MQNKYVIILELIAHVGKHLQISNYPFYQLIVFNYYFHVVSTTFCRFFSAQRCDIAQC